MAKNDKKDVVEKARRVFVDVRVRTRKVSEGDLDLVLAWLTGELRTKQLYLALGKTGSGQVHSVATAILRQAIHYDMVKIDKIKGATL